MGPRSAHPPSRIGTFELGLRRPRRCGVVLALAIAGQIAAYMNPLAVVLNKAFAVSVIVTLFEDQEPQPDVALVRYRADRGPRRLLRRGPSRPMVRHPRLKQPSLPAAPGRLY
ncbi:MAG: hypothetical protein HYV20_10835 [Gemmatimonadetes bacterium]|nr:hypothetical protein [Gemmatimonadota bacterium]